MGKVISFIKSPLGLVLLVLVLVFLYSRWRQGLIQTSFFPAATKGPVPPSPGAGGFIPESAGGIGNP